MKYDIARLAYRARPRKGRVIMPPLSERLVTVNAYRKALRAMLNDLASEVRDGIIPAYRVDTMTRDVDQNTFQRIRALGVALVRRATDAVGAILGLEAIKHTEGFMAQAKKVLGIDISSVIQQEDLGDYLRNANARNNSLIKSLADDTVKQVEQVVIKNQIAGNSVKTLRQELQDTFKLSDNRAQLIARDQSAKLTSDLNRIRQEQAGIEAYQWSTSHDERVRSRHKAIDGIEYKWGEATGAEGGLPPGQPIQCRCIARAVISFDF